MNTNKTIIVGRKDKNKSDQHNRPSDKRITKNGLRVRIYKSPKTREIDVINSILDKSLPNGESFDGFKIIGPPKALDFTQRKALIDPLNSAQVNTFRMARSMIMQNFFEGFSGEDGSQSIRVKLHSGPQLVISGSTSITPGSIPIDFTNLTNASTAAYAALFDRYQFEKGEVVAQGCLNPSATATFSGMPAGVAYIDYDNSTAPTGASFAMQQDDSKIHMYAAESPVRDAVHWKIRAVGIPDQQWYATTVNSTLCWWKYAQLTITGSVPATTNVCIVYYSMNVVFNGVD